MRKTNRPAVVVVRRMASLLLLMSLSALAFVPNASARVCDVHDSTPPVGGVTGMTYQYTFDVANRVARESCGPSGATAAEDLANLTCQYLVGLDCL